MASLTIAAGLRWPHDWHKRSITSAASRAAFAPSHGVPVTAQQYLRREPSIGPILFGFGQRFSSLTKRTSSRASAASASAEAQSGLPEASIGDLKRMLEASLERTQTNLSEESLAIIAELEARNPTAQPALRQDLWAGPFQMLNSSMNNVLYRGCKVSLGKATFNAFKPNSMLITMEEVYNDVHVHGPDSYNVLIPFTIVEDGVPPLKGLLFNQARIIPRGDTKLDVEFLGSVLMPRDESVDLQLWLEVFGKENEMDAKGVCKISLPPAKGWLDLVFLDEDYRITRGNAGTTVVVKRLQAPAIPCSP